MSRFFLADFIPGDWMVIRMSKLVERSNLQLLSFYICAGITITLVEVLVSFKL